jgi:diacylglycerol kinase (ATP)
VVIFNPTAGRGSASTLVQEAQALLGPSFEWRPTMRAGHATELAHDAARTHELVVACGGDGTVGDVARGLIGTEATLGIIPAGTGNDYARNLNLRLDLKEAIATILGGVVARVDYGIINGIPFVNNAGTGFDARVMQTMNTSIRFAKGRSAFILAILKTLPGFKPFTVTLQIDDEPPTTEKAMMVSILNGRMYGGGMIAAPAAEMDDAQLDVMVIRALPKLRLLPLVGSIQSGAHVNHPAVRLFKARRLTMTTTPTFPLNIDGDVTGLTPAQVEVVPRGLKVLVR